MGARRAPGPQRDRGSRHRDRHRRGQAAPGLGAGYGLAADRRVRDVHQSRRRAGPRRVGDGRGRPRRPGGDHRGDHATDQGSEGVHTARMFRSACTRMRPAAGDPLADGWDLPGRVRTCSSITGNPSPELCDPRRVAGRRVTGRPVGGAERRGGCYRRRCPDGPSVTLTRRGRLDRCRPSGPASEPAGGPAQGWRGPRRPSRRLTRLAEPL
jgi:hypothetical protein